MEDGAVEAVEVAAIITKEVFNPLAKLTKGFQNAVMTKGQNQQKADQVNPLWQTYPVVVVAIWPL